VTWCECSAPSGGELRKYRAGAHEAVGLWTTVRQRSFEKLPIALGYDDCRIYWFATSRQLESGPLGLLQRRCVIRKYLADFVLEYR
jgi:hypothetical protein